MTQLETIIANYYKLCDFCDKLWEKVRESYPDEIACRKGCGICCELKSVSWLEAHVIKLYFEENNTVFSEKLNAKADEKCPFLCEDVCLIYKARPLICRTHGLMLRSEEFSQTYAASCPYNFHSFGPGELPDEFTLDIDMITKNLMKLNLAYCICKDMQAEAQTRMLLIDLYKSRQMSNNSAV